MNNYHVMSQLPWVLPPAATAPLGYAQAEEIKRMYPRQFYDTTKIPVSCPVPVSVFRSCPNAGVRIYETGNGFNPNTHSTIGVVTPDDIRW